VAAHHRSAYGARRRHAKQSAVVHGYAAGTATESNRELGMWDALTTITIDGERLEEPPGQNVISHGPDRNLSVDEIGGIQLADDAVAPEA
jgi:hypothetical protein